MTARPNVQMCSIQNGISNLVDDWKEACGCGTDNAAAMMLRVDRATVTRWRGRSLGKVERLAMAALYHRLPPYDRGMTQWMKDCGLATESAAASALQVDRHTVANWCDRDLSHVERLALAALYHRIKPFDRGLTERNQG